MTTHSRCIDPRPARNKIVRDSAVVRGLTGEIVRLAVQASRSSPRGRRAPWQEDLETALLNLEPDTIPLHRVAALLVGAGQSGGDLTAFCDQLASVLRGATAPTGTIPAVRLALLGETDAQCAADPDEARVLVDPQDRVAEARCLDHMKAEVGAAQTAVHALEVDLYGATEGAA